MIKKLLMLLHFQQFWKGSSEKYLQAWWNRTPTYSVIQKRHLLTNQLSYIRTYEMFIRILTILCLKTFFIKLRFLEYLIIFLHSLLNILAIFPIVCNLWSFLVTMHALIRINTNSKSEAIMD